MDGKDIKIRLFVEDKGKPVIVASAKDWKELQKRIDEAKRRMGETQQAVAGTTRKLQEQQGVLSRYVENWKKTFAVFVLGYASVVSFLSIVRSLINEFTLGFRAIEEFRQSVIALSAVTMMFMKASGDLSKDWEKANVYATALAVKAEELDRIYTGTAQELLTAGRALMTMGVQIDTSNQRQLESWVAIAEAAKAVTTGTNKEFQVRQEIQALLEGQTRQGATLARILDRQLKTVEGYGGGLKEALAVWRQQGTVLEEIATRLEGFKLAQQDIQDLVSTQYATLETINRRILRQGFIPAYDELNNLLETLVTRLEEGEKGQERWRTIADRIAYAWMYILSTVETTSQIMSTTADLMMTPFDKIKEYAKKASDWTIGLLDKYIFKNKETQDKLSEADQKRLGVLEQVFGASSALFSANLQKRLTSYEAHLKQIELLTKEGEKTKIELAKATEEGMTDKEKKALQRIWQQRLAMQEQGYNLLREIDQKYRQDVLKEEISQIDKITETHFDLIRNLETALVAGVVVWNEYVEAVRKADAWKNAAIIQANKRVQASIAEVHSQVGEQIAEAESDLTDSITAEYNERIAEAERWRDSMKDTVMGLKLSKEDAEALFAEIDNAFIAMRERAERDAYMVRINIADAFTTAMQESLEAVILNTRKMEDVWEGMKVSLVRRFATALGDMLKKKWREFDVKLSENFEITLPGIFKGAVGLMSSIWEKFLGWMKIETKYAIGSLASTLGSLGYMISGIAGGQGLRIGAGAVATTAALLGHPEIAIATIAVAEIGKAVFKGSVKYVQTGAVAAGMAPSTIGMEQTWWGMGFGMGWLEELSDIFFGWMGGIFSRKWPTVRGKLRLSLDEIEAWFTELKDVKVDEEAVLREFRSWLQSVVDMYLGWIDLLPADVARQLKEILPAIEMPFAAGRKDMELLAKKFATQVILETYLSWGQPIIEELNKALGIDLSEIFGLPDVSGILEMANKWGWIRADLERAKEIWEEEQWEWTGQIESLDQLFRLFEHQWGCFIEDLYDYSTRTLLPTITAVMQYGLTLQNLVDKYGKAIGEIYMEDSATKVKEIVDRYLPQIEQAAEEDVQKLAEEMGKTIEEYLSALVDFVSEIEDTIAKYTMPEPAYELWELENWFKDMAAQAEALGVSTERLNEALARRFFKPIEDILDTRSEYEKARADIEEWYWAHLAFFEAHREMLESLGYSIEDITNAYNRLLEQLEEVEATQIAEAFDRIRDIIEEFTIGAEELAGIRMERLRGKWLDRSLEYYKEHWDELMADAQEYMNLEIELYELRRNKLIEETEAVIAGYRERIDELEDLRREWESVAKSVAQAIQDLTFGPAAMRRPVDIWPSIQAEYERLKTAALTSPEAAKKFLEFYPTYLEYAAKMFKSSMAYQLVLADVLSVLEYIQTYAEEQISEIEAQTQALENAITEAERALESALEALRSETADRLQAVSDWLSEILDAINMLEMSPDINITVTTGTGTATTVAGQPQNIVMGAISGVKYPHAPGRLPMQEGGIVTEPILAQLHPPEAVIPLDRGKINVDMDFDYDRFAKAVRIDEERLAWFLARELEKRPMTVEMNRKKVGEILAKGKREAREIF